jgi:S1-C subfamily serine protease
VNGRPIINAYGYSTLRYRYDEHGRETDRELLDANGRTVDYRVCVDRIAPGSVASESGLMVGDYLLTYDGQTVSTSDHFTNTLERFKGAGPASWGSSDPANSSVWMSHQGVLRGLS